MSTQTLTELAKMVQDDLVGGVVEDIITVNPMFVNLPFTSYEGDAITANRETTLGDAGLYEVGDTITHRTPSANTPFSFTATKLIGQVDMDGLVQAQGKSGGADMTALEISSKSKTISRLFQDQMVNGDGSVPNMNSFHSIVDSSQYTTASAGQALTFTLLDELLDLVTAKDGQVDFLMAHKSVLRKFKALYRALGGADPTTVVIEMPDGTTRAVLSYEGIPFFRNDWIGITETANGAALTGGALTSVWAGCWDDGTRKTGITAIYPEGVPAGIDVSRVGTSETKDEEIYRLKWYTNMAIFNRRAIARLPSINQS